MPATGLDLDRLREDFPQPVRPWGSLNISERAALDTAAATR